MLGIRSYRRTPRPAVERDPSQPRVIRGEASVEDLVLVEKQRHPYGLVMDIGRAKDHSVLMVLSMNPFARPYAYRVHRIHKAPLGTPHLDLARAAGEVRRRLQDAGHQVFAALDATGIGAGTAELVQLECPLTVKIEITGDGRVIADKWDSWRFRVPKRELVDALVNTMELQKLTITAGVTPDETEEFKRELAGFSRMISANKDGTAHIEYGNDTSIAAHDDIVNAAAVGIWSFTHLAEMGMFGGAGDPDDRRARE